MQRCRCSRCRCREVVLRCRGTEVKKCSGAEVCRGAGADVQMCICAVVQRSDVQMFRVAELQRC